MLIEIEVGVFAQSYWQYMNEFRVLEKKKAYQREG
jgi:hypothetical protein